MAAGAVMCWIALAIPTAASAYEGGCDPRYGCNPTTTTTTTVTSPTSSTLGTTPTTIPGGVPTTLPGATPACFTSTSVSTAGARVDVTITNVPIGLTIELRFNGQVVDTKTASSPFTAGAAAAPGFADVPMSFLVPALAPGSYTLEAVGPAFRCECLPGTGFAVLSSGATKPEGGSGTSAGGLARTGVTVAFFVAVALGLVVGGRALLEASRQTRRRAVPRGRHLRDPELEGSDR